MSSRPVTIRDYRESDEAGVIALARELQVQERTTFDRMKPEEDIGPAYVAALLGDVREHDGRFLVAERAGELLGYCTLLTRRDSSGEHDETFYTYSHVSDLTVAARERGAGIGANLLAASETIARDAGQKWLRLNVQAANSGARRFYQRHGFDELLLLLEKTL